MRFTLTAPVLLVVSLFTSSAYASTCPAEGLVQDAADAYAVASRSRSPSAFVSAAGRFTDLRALAMFALGPYRSKLPAGLESKYVSLAKVWMGQFMAKNSGRIGNSDLTITGCSPQMVNARMGSNTTIIFRLSGSRITDVSISGFSLAHAMREKFTGIISDHNGDVTALIDYLDQ